MSQTTHDYKLLWSHIDHNEDMISYDAERVAGMWPGLPVNPIQPNPIPIDNQLLHSTVGKTEPVKAKPISSLPASRAEEPVLSGGAGRTRRGGGYASLSNYNTIP